MLAISNDTTNFGALYIGPAKIKGKVNRTWKDAEVNFVKFQTNLQTDLHSIDAIKYLWHDKNLAPAVSEEARHYGGLANVYALTRQDDKFEKIDPSKILGIMTTGAIKNGNKTVDIYKIGTHPKYAYEQNRRSRDVKHIAKGMLDAFKNFAQQSEVKPVIQHADPSDMKFLKRIGMEPVKKDIVEFI